MLAYAPLGSVTISRLTTLFQCQSVPAVECLHDAFQAALGMPAAVGTRGGHVSRALLKAGRPSWCSLLVCCAGRAESGALAAAASCFCCIGHVSPAGSASRGSMPCFALSAGEPGGKIFAALQRVLGLVEDQACLPACCLGQFGDGAALNPPPQDGCFQRAVTRSLGDCDGDGERRAVCRAQDGASTTNSYGMTMSSPGAGPGFDVFHQTLVFWSPYQRVRALQASSQRSVTAGALSDNQLQL